MDEGGPKKIISIRTLNHFALWNFAIQGLSSGNFQYMLPYLMPLQGPGTISLFNIVPMGKIGENAYFSVLYPIQKNLSIILVPKIKFNQAIMCGSYSKKEKYGSSGYLSQHTCYEVTIPGHIWISAEGAFLTWNQICGT